MERMTARLWLGPDSQDRDEAKFLEKNEEAVSSLITDEESSLLTFIYIEKETDLETLEMTFPRYATRRKIQNLEARGLVRLTGSSVVTRLPFALALYPAFGRRTEKERRPQRTEEFPRALVSFLLRSNRETRNLEGTEVTKPEKCRELFPFMDENAISALIDHLKDNLRLLGLAEEGRATFASTLEFLSLGYEQMLSYILWPGADEDERKKSYLFFRYLYEAGIIEEENYPRIERIATTLSGFALLDSDEDARYRDRKSAFIRTCFFENRDGLLYPLGRCEERNSGITIGSDRTITAYGKPDAMLYMISEPMKIDTSKIFELSKESLSKYFKAGYSADDSLDLLSSLSRHQIPEMVRTLVGFWYDDFKRLTMQRAIVVRTDEEHADRIARIIEPVTAERLSRTCFLVSPCDEERLLGILPQSLADKKIIDGPQFVRTEERAGISYVEYDGKSVLSFPDIPEERKYQYRKSLKDELMSEIDESDGKSRTALRRLMVESGLLFRKDQVNNPLPFDEADAFNYQEKRRLLLLAQKDRECCVQVENHSGQSTIGGVSLVQSYEEGDHTIIGKKMLSISRLYRVRVVPKAFL